MQRVVADALQCEILFKKAGRRFSKSSLRPDPERLCLSCVLNSTRQYQLCFLEVACASAFVNLATEDRLSNVPDPGPLTAILSNAQAAQRFMASPHLNLDEVREILQDIVNDDKRTGEIIQGLRSLLKKGRMRNEPIELNGTIRDVLRLVRSDLLNTGVILTTTLVSDLPNVYGDRIQLQQVVLNLIVNGIDAARRQIRVSTSLAPEHQVLRCG